MKILVTDGNNRAALAITRSLGREGHKVIIGAEELPCLASKSKYCHKNFTYPNPKREPELFVNKIKEIVNSEKSEVLLPVSEITTLTMMSYKDTFDNKYSIPVHSFASVDRAANKYEVLLLARNLGIPIPKTYFLKSPDDLNPAIKFVESEGFPIVLKPPRSRTLNVDGFRDTRVRYANDQNELKTIISDVEEDEYPLLIQERIYGAGVGIFACYDHGELAAIFSHRRIREKPPSGGVSVLRESFPVDPVLKDQSNRLLKALNWHGVAMIEFKYDRRDNVYKLMEINGRFWGSLQLAIDAGVNFPNILVKIATNENLTPVETYKIGVKTRWFWGDVDALILRLFKDNNSLNLPHGFPGKIRYIIDFMKFWGKDLKYEIFDTSDIKPWLFETRRWFSGK